MLHLFPHSLEAISPLAAAAWMLVGFLGMFLLERFFCFHHHDAPADDEGHGHDSCGHDHGDQGHHLTWTGAAVGLTIHSLIAGAALAASVEHAGPAGMAGMAVFLVIFLHKPFDSLTLGTLMVMAGGSSSTRHLVNGLFALAVPVGVVIFHLGMGQADVHHAEFVGAALAFSTGTFVCIASSDLLPELQFHQHDRVKLTLALFVGIALAVGIALIESGGHADHGGSGPHDHSRHEHGGH
jgi:zinc and cadmium transporter